MIEVLTFDAKNVIFNWQIMPKCTKIVLADACNDVIIMRPLGIRGMLFGSLLPVYFSNSRFSSTALIIAEMFSEHDFSFIIYIKLFALLSVPTFWRLISSISFVQRSWDHTEICAVGMRSHWDLPPFPPLQLSVSQLPPWPSCPLRAPRWSTRPHWWRSTCSLWQHSQTPTHVSSYILNCMECQINCK